LAATDNVAFKPSNVKVCASQLGLDCQSCMPSDLYSNTLMSGLRDVVEFLWTEVRHHGHSLWFSLWKGAKSQFFFWFSLWKEQPLGSKV